MAGLNIPGPFLHYKNGETVSRTQFRIVKNLGKINVIETVTSNYKCPQGKYRTGIKMKLLENSVSL